MNAIVPISSFLIFRMNKNETFQNCWRFELGKQKSVLKIIPSKASVRKCAEIADYNNEEIIGR